MVVQRVAALCHHGVDPGERVLAGGERIGERLPPGADPLGDPVSIPGLPQPSEPYSLDFPPIQLPTDPRLDPRGSMKHKFASTRS